jgi:hypothetical protein
MPKDDYQRMIFNDPEIHILETTQPNLKGDLNDKKWRINLLRDKK